MPTKIADIVFDLGNVLISVDRNKAYQRLLPQLPPKMAELLLNDKPAFEKLLVKPTAALETGKASFDEFRSTVERTFGMPPGRLDFLSIWCDMFSIDEEMVAFGESLSNRYGTWLASNTSKVHYDWILSRFPAVAFYKAAALSYELGVMKPDPDYYEKVIRRLQIYPRTSVFIDDLPENVLSAVEAGMKGIVFENRAQLIRDLQTLGVDV